MWSAAWIGLGIFGWITGFFTAGYLRRNGTLIQKTLVRPPFLVFLLCGMPRSRNFASGVMTAPAFMLQLNGILWIIYGLIYLYLPEQSFLLHGALLFVCMILISIYTWTLRDKDSYKIE